MIDLTEDQQNTAIFMAIEGRTLKEIHTRLDVSTHNFWEYRMRHPDFERKFQSARSEGLETIADDLLTIIDDVPDVNKARLKSDNTKWLLSKRKAHTYGDRIDLNVNQTVDIGSALNEAISRSAPRIRGNTEREVQPIDITQDVISPVTDTESVEPLNSNEKTLDQDIEDLLS